MVLLPMPNIKAKTKFFFGHITLVFIILNHTSFFSIIYNKKNKKGEKIYELLKISKKSKNIQLSHKNNARDANYYTKIFTNC